ncbi:MAG: TIGR04086 family membrane protein [Clostridia bacterium]|nr:TIGR04086 family membrane protein [Clostridia bacterium]
MESNAREFLTGRDRGMDSFRRSVRRSVRRGRGKGLLGAVLKGVLVGASITVISVALFALILNWWDASDRAITAINQVVKFVSILAGVAAAMGGEAQGGTMRGICVGLLYMALGIICYCLLMGKNPEFSGYMADLGMGIASGGLFGMILASRKNT